MLRTAWIPALLVAAASPAAAQTQGFSSEVAYDFLLRDIPTLAGTIVGEACAGLINGDATLAEDPTLTKLGFIDIPRTGAHAANPDFVQMARSHGSHYVSVGGVSTSLCEVSVVGPQAAEALKSMRTVVVYEAGLDLEPDPANSGPRGNGSVEALKMQYAEGQVMVQLFSGSTNDGTPSASFQIKIEER